MFSMYLGEIHIHIKKKHQPLLESMQKQTLPLSFNSIRYFEARMLLEDNGLLPFLEVWRFFADPKIQSNTVFVVCLNIYIFLPLRFTHSRYF